MSPVSRRTFLQGAGAVAAATGLGPLVAREVASAALAPVGMAMHVHASFSEGKGSMEAQLTEAKANGVDVLWWTEHDWRMSGHRYRKVVHFDGLTESEDGVPWTWVAAKSGSLSQSSGAIVTSPASPLDSNAPASLRITATGSGTGFAYNRYKADASKARQNLNASLAGQTVAIEVFPQQIGPDAFMEIQVVTSRRPAKGGRQAGLYILSYRLGGSAAAGSRQASGLTGIVTLAAAKNEWNSLVLRPADDLSAIWPDIDGQDASLVDLYVGVGSRRSAPAAGCFDFLRFSRTVVGNQPLDTQAKIMAGYAAAFPSVYQHAGLEVSLYPQHINWYGGALSLPNYGTLPISPAASDTATRQFITDIHAAGGVASFNHPFGVEPGGSALPVADQEAARRKVASKLISNRAFSADLLEAGYRQRGGVTIERHLSVWDACSRNGIFLTGNGVSDNHTGQGWASETNNFLTWAWAAGSAEADLVAALRTGRCFFGDLRRFAGTLDLTVDQACPMGSASLSQQSSRSLAIKATGIPSGGAVQLVQGVVDYAGSTAPDPVTTSRSFPASDFLQGVKTVAVDTTTSSFARVQVVDSAGVLVACSNPVWLLRQTPPQGIPPSRTC
jgi:hypothetical protein